MAGKRSGRTRQAQLAFEALSIEGGLLSPEWLGKLAQLGASQQTEADYGIEKGLTIRDEIGRFWRIAQAQWSEFEAGQKGGGDKQLVAGKFIEALLKKCFGFATLEATAPITIGDRRYPIGFHAVSGRVPVVVAPAGVGLDTLLSELGDDGRKRSAFGLVQEYLNANEAAMWGLATDGLSLRIVRDNASLTRPAWIEVDLARLFTGALYPEFTTLWLMMHESRFGRGTQAASECALEQWRTAGREQGTRARDLLRDGVQDALTSLGQGFLAHRDNQALRDSLKSGALTERAYFQQLLRFVYRLIFLITAEERDLLFNPGATDEQKRLYSEGYGLRRLRERSVRRKAHDRYSDLYEGLKIVFRGLAGGLPALGLPALAGLFGSAQTPALDGLQLENHALLEAIFRLSWIREDSSLSRVNWRDMGPEELGSVYESLLELVPVLTNEGRVFAFASAEESKGNARKTTGSYYTPDSLVQVLLDSALEPVVARTIAANPAAPAEALLSLSIVDPACGSGHFLLAAARRLAAHVARLEANGTPSPKEYRHALRRVVGRCIFGVDLNPMAIELCRLALWMEAVDPGKPLSFLDSHLQQGNALLGTTPELMKNGIPDDAWVALEGDDKKTASALKKRNKKEAKQDSLALAGAQSEVATLTAAAKSLDAASDADPAALAKKQTEWSGLLESVAFQHQKLVADAWCAAFVWPKPALPNAVAEAAPTNETWRQIRDEPARAAALTVQTTRELAREFEFFHWPLQFPQVFAKGGFDLVIGNPPWDQIQFREQEFFAVTAPEIANAGTDARRRLLVDRLKAERPELWAEYARAANRVERGCFLMLTAGRYPRAARGRLNTFLLFSELALVVSTRGVGLVVPSGLATDESGRLLFADLMATQRLRSFWDFDNSLPFFPSVDSRARFALLAASEPSTLPADFCFGLTNVADLQFSEKHFNLTDEILELINPNTRTCPSFVSRRQASLVLDIHRRFPILIPEVASRAVTNGWGAKTRPGLLNMASDSSLFRNDRTVPELLPVYEGKMFAIYDHRAADVVVSKTAVLRPGQSEQLSDEEHVDPERTAAPRYWVSAEEVAERVSESWDRRWLPAWKEITSPTNHRTMIACVLPLSGVGHKAPIVLPSEAARDRTFCLIANLSSYVLDFVCRSKLNGTSLTPFTVKQLPVLPPEGYDAGAGWDRGSLRDWILPRTLARKIHRARTAATECSQRS